MNGVSLDALKSHLFETLEGVKNLSDPKASKCERVSIEQAKAIVDISGKIIDVYKTQVDAIKVIGGMDSVNSLKTIATGLGIADDQTIKMIEG